VNPETRLAEIVAALEDAGVACLVMGGHAVRYYGLRRDTIDFDLHLAPDVWEILPARLAAMPLFAGGQVVEGPSWRTHAFRRFQIGQLCFPGCKDGFNSTCGSRSPSGAGWESWWRAGRCRR
jgi:hypothetical protein